MMSDSATCNEEKFAERTPMSIFNVWLRCVDAGEAAPSWPVRLRIVEWDEDVRGD